MSLIDDTIGRIGPPDAACMKAAQKDIDFCLKPPGSLGKLEDIARRIAGMTGKRQNTINKKAIMVMMADNGVVAEGIAMYPRDVTRIGADFVTSGRMGINFLANAAGADVFAVDLGIMADVSHLPRVIHRKIRSGTANLLEEPAMTREQSVRAVETGIEVTLETIENGYDLIGTGEIGIGNTTSSAAVLRAFTGAPIDRIVGRGAGLTDKAFQIKKDVVETAVRRRRPDPEDPLDVLHKVGGLDICGLAGVYLACASRRIPVVTDGLISNVAALAAMRFHPDAVHYMIPSHLSMEPGALLLQELTGLAPMLTMDMRLGEGTGCALVFPIIEAALRMTEEMGTFASLGKTRDDIPDRSEAYLGKFG